MGMNIGASGGGKKHPPARPQINITPLVDVALVVLIIFMVVTPMMLKTFSINLPKKPDPERSAELKEGFEKEHPLVMTLARSGEIRINRVPVSRAELPERLPRMLAAASQKVLFFDAEDGTPYGSAVTTLDAARRAGAKSIAIATQRIAY